MNHGLASSVLSYKLPDMFIKTFILVTQSPYLVHKAPCIHLF